MEQLTLDLGVTYVEDAITARQPQTLEEKIEYSKKVLILASDLSKTYYHSPLILTYSGGKDSDVMLNIALDCLKPSEFEVLNSHTTVDAPETVYYIREVFSKLREKGIKATVNIPKYADGTPITMWNLIINKGLPPTRLARYCCKELKETHTPNRIAALGVRADESNKRKGRDAFGVRSETYKKASFFSYEHTEEVYRESQEINDPVWDCTLIKVMKEKGDTVVNPIYEWTDVDVWDYINKKGLEVNPLYSKGYPRVGCIGCPLAAYKQKLKEFSDYPTYRKAYINAFQKMLEKGIAKGKDYSNQENPWTNGQDVFDWWMEEGKHNVKGQMNLFEEG